VRRFRRLRNAGYRIVAFFLWLPSVKLAIARVANRVKQGGHHVPESDIRRRFAAGLRNFHDDYAALFDAWWLYDGSQIPPQLIAHASDGKIEVDKTEVYERAKQSLDG
jgi:predicted ABC-type ATPase